MVERLEKHADDVTWSLDATGVARSTFEKTLRFYVFLRGKTGFSDEVLST